MVEQEQAIEDYRVRREIEHTNGPDKDLAIELERERRVLEGPPSETTPTDGEVEDVIDRWLDPEPVPRSMITAAVWEMERHYWTRVSGLTHCQCGVKLGDAPSFELMRAHKEDVLAKMLGLTIKPEPTDV